MSHADRMPPYNLEAERGVLGACLLDARAIDEAALILAGREDFWVARHQIAWDVICEMRALGHEVDAVSLGDRLDQIEEFRGQVNDFLGDLAESVPHAANAAYHAGIVREKALGRSVIEACEETLRDCYGRLKTAPEILAAMESRIFALGEREAAATATMGQTIGGAMEVIGERANGKPAGVMTGFDDLDDVLCGLRPGTLSILAARPSIGKTAMGMAIGANVGRSHRKPVLLVSLEMDKEEIGERYLAAHAEINGRALKDPARCLDDASWGRLEAAAGRLCALPIHIDDAPVRTVGQIAASARRLKRRQGLAMVIVDYLGLIDGERRRGESRQEEVARISRDLKAMAKHLACPVLALHQLNRQPESRDDRRPRMSDLRESGAIEQDAHVVMLLHRPDFYDPMDRPGMAEVIVAKNRSGATSAVEVAFRKEWTRFESVQGPAPFAPGIVISDETSF